MNTSPTIYISPTIFRASAKEMIFFAESLIIISALLLVLIHGPVHLFALGWGVLAGTAYVVMQSFFASQIYTVEVSKAGIRSYSTGGKEIFLQWYEIQTVRRFSLFNLRYLRLYGSSPSAKIYGSSQSEKVKIWVPLFIQNQSAFIETIKWFAPKDSPLLAYL